MKVTIIIEHEGKTNTIELVDIILFKQHRKLHRPSPKTGGKFVADPYITHTIRGRVPTASDLIRESLDNTQGIEKLRGPRKVWDTCSDCGNPANVIQCAHCSKQACDECLAGRHFKGRCPDKASGPYIDAPKCSVKDCEIHGHEQTEASGTKASASSTWAKCRDCKKKQNVRVCEYCTGKVCEECLKTHHPKCALQVRTPKWKRSK